MSNQAQRTKRGPDEFSIAPDAGIVRTFAVPGYPCVATNPDRVTDSLIHPWEVPDGIGHDRPSDGGTAFELRAHAAISQCESFPD